LWGGAVWPRRVTPASEKGFNDNPIGLVSQNGPMVI